MGFPDLCEEYREVKWSYALFNQYTLLDREHLLKMNSHLAEDYEYRICTGEQTIPQSASYDL